MDDLKLVKKYEKELTILAGIASLLNWDKETYMPREGVGARAEQEAYIEGIYHKKFTSEELFEALKRLKEKELPEDERIHIETLYRKILKARKVPQEFVEELSKTASKAFVAWEESKKKNDFKIFQPHLEKIVELKKRESEYLGISGSPYNSLLDEFEEGLTAEALALKFQDLKISLISLLEKIKSSPNYEKNDTSFDKNFDKNIQIELAKDVIKRIGLKEESSRMDFAEHPFSTTIGFKDHRITTNIRKSPLFSFHSSVHEAGHSLYELGIPEKIKNTILGRNLSYSIHESQSRFWENMIAKSPKFWEYYFNLFKEKFGLEEDSDKWIEKVNEVKATPIRIESDEVHYCLHIILRFEIEKDLIEDKIKVEDLPKIWNEKMQEFFGIIPQSDKEGVLQDVHWSQGYFGYFPTYALGTIYASQIYNALKKEYPNIEEKIKEGDFSIIQEWLSEKIHRHGAKYQAEELMKKTVGEGLNPKIYINYLEEKYLKIYPIS